MKEFLQRVYYNNTVQDYLIALGGMILAWLILQLFRKVIVKVFLRWASRTTHDFDEVLVHAFNKYLLPYLYLLINYTIISQLTLSERLQKILDVSLLVITVYFIIKFINYAIEGFLEAYLKLKNEPAERMRQIKGILIILQVIVWIVGLIMLIDNLGYNVTTIIAGLGVGGIAIALAAQNILSDLFSYFVIFFDKPFEIGDFIIVGTESGTVERIGIKTSHLRSLDGEQMIMPNAELVKRSIRNFKRLQKRRRLFTIGVTYQTSQEFLKAIPNLIQQTIEQTPYAEFQRCHLSGFADFSINFEVVYFVLSDNYNIFMETHQQICLNIVKAFEERGIEFAYPTRTLFIYNEEAVQKE